MLMIGLLAWTGLAGCGPKFLEEDLGGARHIWTRTNSNRQGTEVVKIQVEDGETAMLATVQVDAPNQVHFRAVRDPADNEVFQAFEWNESPYSKTNGGFVAGVATLNWPIVGDDPELYGGRWELEFGVVDDTQTYIGAPLYLDVLLKRDAAFTSGELAVSIVYTEGLEDDAELRDAVATAQGQWRDLYAAMGIDVSFDSYAFPDTALGPPAYGTEDAYFDISADTAPRSVNLVISDQIADLPDIFGIAGDIPGPLVPTSRSAVQISALLAAGPDGKFDAEDTRLLAETMAHEVGHYLGLFHPVEATWDAWDVLDDTPECDQDRECVTDLGTNLMFPYPVCGPASCTPQSDTTDEQAAVANRYTGVW
ncbi:MAG: hypothetical protein ABMB14_20730 [Myxococcota bacterium]